MDLKDICRRSRDRALWRLSLAFFSMMMALSASLYLWRWNQEALRVIEEARSSEQVLRRLEKEYEKVTRSGLPPLPSEDPSEAVASVLDYLTLRGGARVVISGMKEDPGSGRVGITLAGEGPFEAVTGILQYVQGTYYPVLVTRGITLSPKGSHLDFKVEIEVLLPGR